MDATVHIGVSALQPAWHLTKYCVAFILQWNIYNSMIIYAMSLAAVVSHSVVRIIIKATPVGFSVKINVS